MKPSRGIWRVWLLALLVALFVGATALSRATALFLTRLVETTVAYLRNSWIRRRQWLSAVCLVCICVAWGHITACGSDDKDCVGEVRWTCEECTGCSGDVCGEGFEGAVGPCDASQTEAGALVEDACEKELTEITGASSWCVCDPASCHTGIHSE